MIYNDSDYFWTRAKMNCPADEENVVVGASGNPNNASTTRHVAVVSGRLDSRALFVGTREIIISHGDERYRLRLTSQNKLILTK